MTSHCVHRPVHGLIFLFKWRPGDEPQGESVTDERNEKIYFAQQVLMPFLCFATCFFIVSLPQVIQNACATQALINLLMNVKHDDVKLGETLTEFQQFTQAFEPAVKCLSK